MAFVSSNVFILSWLNVFVSTWQTVILYMRSIVQRRINIIMFPLKERELIYKAYDQSKGEPFQMHTPDSVITIVSKPDQIRQIAHAPNKSLSLHAAAKHVLKPQYTMAGFNWHNIRGVEGTGFVRTLQTLLTNHLPQMTPGVRSIMERGFASKVGKLGTVNALAVSKKVVTDISSFAFFGRDQLENHDSMKAAYHYNEDVLYGAKILRIIPQWLVPVAGKIVPRLFNTQRKVCTGLTELFKRRMNSPLIEKYNDVCQWILETSPKDENRAPKWSADRMAMEVMAVWFGSVQGLATTLTFALYNLCDHPEYIKPLRREVLGPEGSKFLVEGEGLPLMDSFLKECARWTPVESVTSRRAAMQDSTFSDGTVLKKGDWVAAALGPMLQDDTLFPKPREFNDFRFADPKHTDSAMSVQPEGPSKFTDVSEKYQVWGTGKITCPGRFFVSYVMKQVFFYILENYEPSMESKGEKHTLTWWTLSLPRPGIDITFAERMDTAVKA